MSEDSEEAEKDAAASLVSNFILKRNVRCALAYMSTRLERLQRVAWECGKHLPPHILAELSPSEVNYFNAYVESIDAVSKEYSQFTALDLTVDMNPPKELFIEVRVKKEYGQVVLPESGEVNLKKNTTHFLRRSEADQLIKQGILEEVI